MKKLTVSIMMAVCVVMGTTTAFAANASGTVAGMISNSYGYTFIVIEGAANWEPCNVMHRYVVNTNTQGGRTLLSNLLAIWLSGKTVTVIGNGNCSTWGDSEDISYIIF